MASKSLELFSVKLHYTNEHTTYVVQHVCVFVRAVEFDTNKQRARM